MYLIPWKRKNGNRAETLPTVDRFRFDFNRIFDNFLRDPWAVFGSDSVPVSESWNPSLDLSEDGKGVQVRVEVPGVSPDDVQITLDGNVLTISGEKKEEKEEKKNCYRSERHFGSFQRRIHLPDTIDAEKIAAEHENGVLTVRVAKTEGAPARKIQVRKK